MNGTHETNKLRAEKTNELHATVVGVIEAWKKLETALVHRLESHPERGRTQAALDRVQATTRTANAAVDRALMGVM
jgi:hypothetical protein